MRVVQESTRRALFFFLSLENPAILYNRRKP